MMPLLLRHRRPSTVNPIAHRLEHGPSGPMTGGCAPPVPGVQNSFTRFLQECHTYRI